MRDTLATAQITPDSSTGCVLSVINHLSFQEHNKGRRMNVEYFQKLCWIWEWNPEIKKQQQSPNNVILAQERIRRGSGFCVNTTTHVTRYSSDSTPAYGIGIEVNWSQEDVAGGRVGGVSALARWTSAANKRMSALREKLLMWMKSTSMPNGPNSIPLADLPPLEPSEPSLFPKALPMPSTPSSWREGWIESPSRHANRPIASGDMLVYPPSLRFTTPTSSSLQNDTQVPMTRRRAALRKRPKSKSENEGSSGTKTGITTSARSTKIRPQKKVPLLGYDKVHRVPDIAISVWMLFTTTSDNHTSTLIQRRASGVIRQVKGKLSETEATHALRMLCRLCPSFLRSRDIDGETWLEMPIPCMDILDVYERIHQELQDDPFV